MPVDRGNVLWRFKLTYSSPYIFGINMTLYGIKLIYLKNKTSYDQNAKKKQNAKSIIKIMKE